VREHHGLFSKKPCQVSHSLSLDLRDASYRKKLLILYGDEVKTLFEEIAARSDFSFETLEVDQDHIHCLVKSEPRLSPLAIVRRRETANRRFSYGKGIKLI